MGKPGTISIHRFRISDHGLVTAFVATLLLWGLHIVWLSRDTRPPVWDMALHQAYALNYAGDSAPESVKLWEKSGNYPPFVHLVIAAVFWIFHPGPHIAVMANIPATFILFWAVYLLAKDFTGPPAGRWACLLLGLTPYAIWISRETILDYWLAAWYAAALAILRRTEDFESRAWTLLLGAVLALGLLTKWFFAGIILIPLVYACVNSRIWRYPSRCIHLLDALILAGVLAAPWYLPNLPRLLQYFGQNAGIGAREGEPPVFSFQSAIYYLRLLEGYQLFGFLFALLVLACIFCWKKKLIGDWKFLAVSIAGGWLVMTLLRTKDPRFTLPLLGPLAIIPAVWIQSWKRTALNNALKAAIIAVLCFQAYAANFGVPWLPERAVILRGYQGSLRWDWNLYLQNYFDILGKPKREDWRQDEILRRIALDSKQKSVEPSLALIPDLPWFNGSNFKLYAAMRGVALRVGHLQWAADGIDSFRGFNYVLMTERDQGMSWTTGNSLALNRIVVDHPGTFRLVELYPLPNGDCARLYSIQRAG